MSKIVEITKRLTMLEYAGQQEHNEDNLDDNDKDGDTKKSLQAIDFSVEEGIYQAGELVDIFRGILSRINNREGSTLESNSNNSHVFPMNDLHPTHAYGIMIDWDASKFKDEKDQ